MFLQRKHKRDADSLMRRGRVLGYRQEARGVRDEFMQGVGNFRELPNGGVSTYVRAGNRDGTTLMYAGPFVLSSKQLKHATRILEEVPALKDLRRELCPSIITEGTCK